MKYTQLVNLLALAGSAEPESEAFILLSHFFSADRAQILAFPEREYDSLPLDLAITRRSEGEPIQYIIGKADFFGLEFKVSPDCLIPRYDTEILCEELVRRLPENSYFLEFCTGSGCIPIAVIKNRPDVSCTSVELFTETADIARENRELNCVSADRLEIIVGDALNFDSSRYAGKLDAIVSNPPYIPTSVVETLSREVKCEPRAALDGGADGLIFYRKFVSSYSSALKPNGFFAFEIGFDQGESVKSLGIAAGLGVEIIRDYSGNDRVAILKKNY